VVGDEDVLVRVHAAGVDPSVWHLMEGTPYLVRAMGFGLRAPKVRVRGWDAAGRVATVGRSVTRLRPGDEVFGACEGSFAEYARAPADQLAPKPVNLSYEEAAVVPVSACTALHALREKGEVRSGQRVLVIGAAGGVGSFAVQLAKAFGAEVTGVCSPRKLDLVRSIGADDVIDYTREDFADGRRRYDVVLDMAGRRSLRDLRRALAPAGTLVMIGGEGGGRWLGGAQRSMLWGPALSRVGRQRLRGLFSTERTEDLLALKDLIEAGEITPALDRTYALSEVPEAIRYVRDGQARGKVAITVRPAIP
jgi:NADPH:quinone reductase-like Zn-dependent oxidoreductase